MKKTVGVDAIYVISLCPRDYTGNADVKQACETDMSDDVIHQLPVSGGQSSFVYRNIYCAACHSEPSPQFWLVSMRHCEGRLSDNECQLAFHPSSYEDSVPRTCLQSVSSCADDWHNVTLAAICRDTAASYVTDGHRAFRNRYCAQCNHIDDSQLYCVQLPPLPSRDVVKSRFHIVYDLNTAQRLDSRTAPSSATPYCDDDQVYDPLLSVCVALPYCASSWTRCGQSTMARRLARNVPSLECPAGGLVGINSSDYVRYDNGSVFVMSLQTLYDADSCRYDNETIYVCIPLHQTSSFSLILFNLDDMQRLVSVVATVVGLLALVALLTSYCVLVGCRRDNSSKMAVCLLVSILLYHVIYLLVLARSRLQLIVASHLQLASLVICAGLQYFAMTTFFWLHVLSIEAFRAVKLWYTTQMPCVTSCTALLVYSLYAWCVPALLVGWSTALPLLAIDSWQLVDQSPSCCVLGLLQLLLFVTPLAVSLLINVILYVLSALMLCRRSAHHYDTDTLLPDRHSPKVDTQWTTRSWSVERLRTERRAAESANQRWNDIYVTCVQTSLLLVTTWTLCLLSATGWVDWPAALCYVYIVFDLALVMTVCLSWCAVDRVCHVLATRKRHRSTGDDARPTDQAAAAAQSGRVTCSAGRRTPPAFNDAGSLRLFMRETSI